MPKLTKAGIEAAFAGKKDAFMWDSDVPGFGVRIATSGRKTYVIRYRNKHHRDKMYTFGRCCDMHPQKARDTARELFSEIARGADPATEARELRDSATVAELMSRCFAEHYVPNTKPTTQEGVKHLIAKHINPNLGALKVSALEPSDVASFLNKLVGKEGVRRRVYDVLAVAFRLAETWGYREKGTHPLGEYKRPKSRYKGYVLSVQQIADIMRTLDGGAYPEGFVRLVKLLFLTGCRKAEIANAKAEWVDVDNRVLRLPDSKSGARNVVLSEIAVELIRPALGQTYICARDDGMPFYRCHHHWYKVLKEVGVHRGVRIHDIRHTVASLAGRSGIELIEVSKLLGHSRVSTTEKYLHWLTGGGTETAEKVAGLVGVR